MNEGQQQAPATSTPAALPPDQQLEVPGTSTPDAAQETDEQRNARELAAQEERAAKRRDGIQRRFDELTADKHRERERADRAERELDFARRSQQERLAPQQDVAPRRDQFETYEDFLEAKTGWAARQAALQVAQQVRRQQDEERARTTTTQVQQQIERAHDERMASYAKANPDFEEALQASTVSVPEVALNYLKLLDNGPEIAHELLRNPDHARRLARAPGYQVGVILGEISAALKQKAPQHSTAPDPGQPVGSRPAPSGSPPEDTEAYFKYANKKYGVR